MSDRGLLVEVRLADSRYHGVGDWPPSPFRLFQALVAGAYGGRWCAEPREQKDAAFEWLEALAPPVVAAPSGVLGRAVSAYVPHNDADVGEIQNIRAEKPYRPRTVDATAVLRYAWRFEDGEEHATRIAHLAERLYALGRGIDPAYSRVSLADWTEVARILGDYGQIVHEPCGPGVADDVRCPAPGSLASLRERYDAMATRFEARRRGRVISTLFRQPPRTRCAMVAYDRGPTRLLFDLTPADASKSFRPVPQHQTVSLTMMVRDLAARRLAAGLPGRERDVERFVIGRGITARESHRRIRFVPLPSIGHAEADPAIRRVMIEIPRESPFVVADVDWALSGQALPSLDRVEIHSGEVAGETLLRRSSDERMLDHYGVGGSAMVWRSITPVALPVPLRAERGIPRHGGQQARLVRSLSTLMADALRHAGFDARGVSVRVQREPFLRKGRLSINYAASRFSPSSLHHVEVTFPSVVRGPVIVGDGRFLGLGLFAPVRRTTGVHVFAVEAIREDSGSLGLARALRRAGMSRVQPLVTERRLPAFFSGHHPDGAPSRAEQSHLSFVVDPDTRRLFVIAPHLIDHREPTGEEFDNLDVLDRAMAGLRELRAGRAGLLTLTPVALDAEADPLFAPSRTWETVTPYVVTRHQKGNDAHAALAADVRHECRRRGLPEPAISVKAARGVPGTGLTGSVRLDFHVAVRGPIVLGRDRHFGGGLFRGLPFGDGHGAPDVSTEHDRYLDEAFE